jgi:hypothetical protein
MAEMKEDAIAYIREIINTTTSMFDKKDVENDTMQNMLVQFSDYVKKGSDSTISKTHYTLLISHCSNIFPDYILSGTQNISDIPKVDKKLPRILRGIINNLRSDCNNSRSEFQIDTRNRIIAVLKSYNKFKADGYLPDKYLDDIKQLYLLLLDIKDRYSARYQKTPFDWMCLGVDAGLLEDMVVVMRLTSQVGLPERHLISINELIDFFSDEKTVENYEHRFLFLIDFIKNNSKENISVHFSNLIKNQRESVRIGLYTEKGVDYFYSLQGLFGVPYDPRVSTVVTPDNCPSYAIHFTVNPIANAIWNNETTYEQFPVGYICKPRKRYARDIHGITQIQRNPDGSFEMKESHKFIRFRMVHGINDNVTKYKYQTGLIIDLKKLVNYLKPGSVVMNELTTMLCSEDIPRDCIIDLIDDKKIDPFWGVKEEKKQ